MKIRGPEPNRRRGMKAHELVRPTEEEDNLTFSIYDFFSPEEWQHIGTVLAEAKETDEDIPTWLESLLSGAVALSFLDPEQLEQVRKNVNLKGAFQQNYQEVVDSTGVTDEEVLTTEWLFPGSESEMSWRLRESYKDDIKQNGSVQYFTLLAFFDPNIENEILMDTQLMDELMEDNRDTIKEMLKIALFKSHLIHQKELIEKAKQVRRSLLANRKGTSKDMGIKELSDRLIGMAFVRVAFAERVEIKDQGFVIHDAVPVLDRKTTLPERPQA